MLTTTLSHAHTSTAVHTDQTVNTNARAVVSSPYTSDGELNASLNYRLCDTAIKPNEREEEAQARERKKGNEKRLCVTGWVGCGVCMFLLHLFGTVASVQLKTLYRSHLLCNGIETTHTFFFRFLFNFLHVRTHIDVAIIVATTKRQKKC